MAKALRDEHTPPGVRSAVLWLVGSGVVLGGIFITLLGTGDALWVICLSLVISLSVISIGTRGHFQRWSIAGLGVIALLLTRPSLLGEVYAPLGAIVWLLVALLTWRHITPAVRSSLKLPILLLMTLWLYVALVDASRGSGVQLAVTAATVSAVTMIGGYCLGSSPRISAKFLRLLKFVLAWPVTAYWILVWPVSDNRQPIGSFSFADIGGRDWIYEAWDAGVITTGSGGFLSAAAPRLSGWFAEPGLMAAVVVVVAGIDVVSRGRPTWFLGIAAAGVLATQSTAGGVALLGLLVAWLISRPRGWLRV